MKALKVIWPALLVLWAVFVFLASNGPADVQARAGQWLGSPLLGSIPLAVLEFASSRVTIALTALLVGVILGWHLRNRRSGKRPSWHSKLATDMAVLAHGIETNVWRSDAVERLNAELLLVKVASEKRGLAFPTAEQGFQTLNDFLPYLHRVSVLLRAGEIPSARAAANVLALEPPDPARHRF